MQSVLYFSISLAFATLALASSQQDQVQPGYNASPVVESAQVQPPQQPQSVVVNNAPVPVSVHPGPEQQVNGPVVPVEHHQVHHQVHPQHFPGASYYAPAGLIQVVGEQQQGVVGGNKPQGVVAKSVEQYGQPESAALPPNYKPFGSWGLYIGGNPADGYYTNYYKQLSSSVEKAQSGVQGEQSVKPSSALSPMLKQASGISPFAGGDYYPFAYSMNDLSSAAVSRSFVSPAAGVEPGQQHHSQVVGVAPVQSGPQVYQAYPESGHFGVESYAATKRLGSAFAQQKDVTKAIEQQPSKGYQSRVYVYPQQVGPLSAPVAFSPVQHGPHQQHQHQQQVVAYPVPVASQIVGSQAGVDGAFAPYGVHAFTRYAVKPTVVGSSNDQVYHYGLSSQLPAAYPKQQQQQSSVVYSPQQSGHSYYQPLSYYGYPMSQLHYSQGSIVPAVHGGEMYPGSPQVGGSQVEASEKSESSSNSEVSNKQQQQQKRA